MNKNIFFTLFFFITYSLHAQLLDPIKWSHDVKDIGPSEAELIFTAKIDGGWHLYDMNLPEDGPVPTSFTFDEIKGGKLNGSITAKSPLIKKYDELFEMELRWFNNEAVFVQKITITDKDNFRLNAHVRFMACDSKQCLSPATHQFSLTSKDIEAVQLKKTESPEEKEKEKEKDQKQQEKIEDNPVISTPDNIVSQEKNTNDTVAVFQPRTNNVFENEPDLWRPVINELKGYGEQDLSKDTSWLIIFLLGFGGGLLALLTPCVWPIIPMTVSFFLKRNENRKRAVKQSILYGLSIIVIYLTLGLVITGIFGASALNDLSTNAIFNLLFFALLVVFAVSFFGAFDIVLPSSWTNKMNEKADSTMGLLGVFFMAFTLVLVSFSCTGPIIGTLLVQAASMSSIIGPAVGMFGFALALAIPFSLFAVFPSWLKNMPKSGGWLNSVKVVLGFLELALALKFFSVADLAYHWHLLDRETFLVLWIVIFMMLGFYLLGKIKFPHDSELKHVSIPRFFMSLASFAFAVYLIPGLWGAPLKSTSAFLPPLSTQDFNLYDDAVHAKFDDYDIGMQYAQKNNKPVVIDFSGFGCVNCRKMETAVWIDPKVKSLLENGYVLITLFVDDKAKLPQPFTVNDAGKQRTIETIGEKWSYLQRYKFGSNAQPFYVLLDHTGNPLGKSYGFSEDVEKFKLFLQNGLKEFTKRFKI